VLALADIQLFFRNAVVTGDVAHIRALLSDATDPENGLGIHRRNYEVSLVTALLTKFPATVWLAGTSFVTEAARDFIRHHPPQAPCIAEYGDEFPRFLAGFPVPTACRISENSRSLNGRWDKYPWRLRNDVLLWRIWQRSARTNCRTLCCNCSPESVIAKHRGQ